LNPNPRIEKGGKPVGDQVKEKKQKAVDENYAGYEKDIPVDYSTYEELTDTWNREDLLNNQTSRENACGEGSCIGDQGKKGRTEGV
jgi:hypothetical protein